jgi:hypothetical protein
MSAGSMSAQGRKTGAAAETVQKRENSTRKNGATRKRMCSKLSAMVATTNFQQKKQKVVDLYVKFQREALAKL